MAQITEDYVSFETAKLLNEKGFNEPIRAFYKSGKVETLFGWHTPQELNDGTYAAPTLQMAMKWLREVHKIHIDTVFLGPSLKWTPTIWKIDVTIPESKHLKSTLNTWDSYEDACEAAIKYCLNNLI